MKLRLLLLMALPAFSGGCASFYLHDAATQKATDSAKTALDSVKLDAVFDSQASYLDGFEKDETTAIIAKYAALRDHEILQFLDGPGPEGLDGLVFMKQQIDRRLMALTGMTDRMCGHKLWRRFDNPNGFSIDPDTIEQGLAGIQKEMQKDKCVVIAAEALPDEAGDAAPNKTPPTPQIDATIKTVRNDLKKIEADQDEAESKQDELKTKLSDAEKLLAAGTTDASTLDTALANFKTALQGANPVLKQLASKTLNDRISDIVAAYDPEASSDSTTTKQARSAIAVVQALAGVSDANASRIPHPYALAATQSWLNYIYSQAANDLQNQQTLLKDHSAQLTASVATIYFLSKAGEEVQKITKQIEPPKGAKWKCPQNNAELGKANDRKKKEDCGTQGLADLFDTSDGTNTRAIDGAILYYASAWTRGLTPQEILSRRTYIDKRRITLASSRAAGTAWMGTLKPAVETLASYGAGGFDPQVLAQLIQALGVGGIAAGVNR